MASGFTVKIVRCRNLPAKDADGFSDPYVKLKLGNQPKQKTKVLKKTLNPEFNQEFKYPTWGSTEKLTASVWDWNRVAKKVFIGQVIFSHPDKGVVSGSFPLVNQKGETVGGTMEVTISSEYLIGAERRSSLGQRRKSSGGGDRRLSVEAKGPEDEKKSLDSSPSAMSDDFTAISPSSSSPPVFIHGLDDSQHKLAFTPETGGLSSSSNRQRERERDVEKEREKERALEKAEREKEKERDKIREKERAEEKLRFEEMMKRFTHLEAENKKQSATIESLEKELAEVRRTVTGLEEWSHEGKAHMANSGCAGGCIAWFIRTFPCCFSSSKRVTSQKNTIKLEDTEMAPRTEIRTNGSI